MSESETKPQIHNLKGNSKKNGEGVKKNFFLKIRMKNKK